MSLVGPIPRRPFPAIHRIFSADWSATCISPYRSMRSLRAPRPRLQTGPIGTACGSDLLPLRTSGPPGVSEAPGPAPSAVAPARAQRHLSQLRPWCGTPRRPRPVGPIRVKERIDALNENTEVIQRGVRWDGLPLPVLVSDGPLSTLSGPSGLPIAAVPARVIRHAVHATKTLADLSTCSGNP